VDCEGSGGYMLHQILFSLKWFLSWMCRGHGGGIFECCWYQPTDNLDLEGIAGIFLLASFWSQSISILFDAESV
jgi:hypothetical protein